MSAPASVLQRTPLAAWHRRRGAALVDFAGWEMPVQYTGILDEHVAVRERAGLFDVSHMGRLFVRGAGAEAFLQRLTTNDVSALAPGRGQYTLCCNTSGGVRDDLIVFRLEGGEYLVVMNAGNRRKIADHFAAHAGPDVELANRSDELAMIAFQGPKAEAVIASLAPGAAKLARFQIARLSVAGVEQWVSRTGYTGEDGFELYPPAERAEAVWNALLEAGKGLPVLPCGLGARDGLRLEVAYPLYGCEIDEETTPWEASLGWVVRMEKGDFEGRSALAAARVRAPAKRLAAFKVIGPGVPRRGYPLAAGDREAGRVTSGTWSPCLKAGIGLGFLPADVDPAAPLAVIVRGRRIPVERVTPPFWRTGSIKSVGVGGEA